MVNVPWSTEKPLLEGIFSTVTSASASSVGFSISKTADLEVPNFTVPNVKKGAFENWIKLNVGTSFSLLPSSLLTGLKSRNPLRVDAIVSDILIFFSRRALV